MKCSESKLLTVTLYKLVNGFETNGCKVFFEDTVKNCICRIERYLYKVYDVIYKFVEE